MSLISQGRDYLAACPAIQFTKALESDKEVVEKHKDQLHTWVTSSGMGRLSPINGYNFALEIWSHNLSTPYTQETEKKIQRSFLISRCRNIAMSIMDQEKEAAARAFLMNKLSPGQPQLEFLETGDDKAAALRLDKLLVKWQKVAKGEVQLKTTAEKEAKKQRLASPEYKIAMLEQEIAALEAKTKPVFNLYVDIDKMIQNVTAWVPNSENQKEMRIKFVEFFENRKKGQPLKKEEISFISQGGHKYLFECANCKEEGIKIFEEGERYQEASWAYNDVEREISAKKAALKKLQGEAAAPAPKPAAPQVPAVQPQPEAPKPTAVEPQPEAPKPAEEPKPEAPKAPEVKPVVKKASACKRFFQKIGRFFAAIGRWIASLFKKKA